MRMIYDDVYVMKKTKLTFETSNQGIDFIENFLNINENSFVNFKSGNGHIWISGNIIEINQYSSINIIHTHYNGHVDFTNNNLNFIGSNSSLNLYGFTNVFILNFYNNSISIDLSNYHILPKYITIITCQNNCHIKRS